METATIPAAEPSMSDLRAMLAGSEPTEPKTETPEPVKAEPEPEAVQETVETKQEPIEKDEPLPPGVEKRIAKEVERAAKYQRQIDEAVSTRKAKEKQLADLTVPGSQPEPTSAAVKQAPEFGEKGHESETYADFQKRDREHLKAEIAAETRKSLEQEFTQRQRETEGKARRESGIKGVIEAGAVKDAAEFNGLMESAQEIASDGLQSAISRLSNWAGVAVHLAKNPAQLKELSAVFEDNPVEAIATLGHIQAGLKSKASKPADEPKLPNPPAKEGGGASASSGAFDIEKASVNQLRRHAEKLGLRKAG